MKKHVCTILLLFVISFSSFTVASDPFDFEGLIGVEYSDKLVPGVEISWILKKYVNPEPWEIVPGHEIHEGDILKLNITKDPDDFGHTDPGEIFMEPESWCDFYLNNVYIANVSTDVIWGEWGMLAGFLAYILPQTLKFNDSSEESFFDYLYTAYTSDTMDYFQTSAKMTDETLTLEAKYTGKSDKISIIGPSSYDFKAKYVINLEWGVIVLIDYEVETALEKSAIILETGLEDIAVPFEWLYGVFAFLILGLAAYRRKRY